MIGDTEACHLPIQLLLCGGSKGKGSSGLEVDCLDYHPCASELCAAAPWLGEGCTIKSRVLESQRFRFQLCCARVTHRPAQSPALGSGLPTRRANQMP